MQRLQIATRFRRVAVQHRFVAERQLDERLLPGEPRPLRRELLLGGVLRGELRVDVAIDEERRAAHDRRREQADDQHDGDHDRDDGLLGFRVHITWGSAPYPGSVARGGPFPRSALSTQRADNARRGPRPARARACAPLRYFINRRASSA